MGLSIGDFLGFYFWLDHDLKWRKGTERGKGSCVCVRVSDPALPARRKLLGPGSYRRACGSRCPDSEVLKPRRRFSAAGCWDVGAKLWPQSQPG